MRRIFSLPVLAASLAGAAALGPFGAARADVVISSAATQNMSCSGGICVPTEMNAVLNVGDLETMLAAGNATVTTWHGLQVGNLEIKAPLTWTDASSLTLDAYQSVTIDKTVSVAGPGGLSLTTNGGGGGGGALSFASKGHVVFANLSSPLAINGVSYSLVDSVQSLANAIAANPAGAFALANDYDAKVDGTYTSSPVRYCPN